jgi:methionine-rich copper-binding protein CopC
MIDEERGTMTHARPWAMIAAPALLIALTLGAAGAASAHDSVIASSPAADSTVTEVPAQFSVTSSEDLLDLAGNASGFALQVIDGAGRYYGDGCLSVTGAVLAMGATLGEPGPYRFLWQFVSSDGHTASGEFAFTWQPPADAGLMQGTDAPPVCGEAPTPIATASPTPEPTVTQSAVPIAEPVTPQPVDLSTVLWIGGGVLAVLVAGGITLLVVSRRRT